MERETVGGTPGKAEGEREVGTEAPIAAPTPEQAEGEREGEREAPARERER